MICDVGCWINLIELNSSQYQEIHFQRTGNNQSVLFCKDMREWEEEKKKEKKRRKKRTLVWNPEEDKGKDNKGEQDEDKQDEEEKDEKEKDEKEQQKQDQDEQEHEKEDKEESSKDSESEKTPVDLRSSEDSSELSESD